MRLQGLFTGSAYVSCFRKGYGSEAHVGTCLTGDTGTFSYDSADANSISVEGSITALGVFTGKVVSLFNGADLSPRCAVPVHSTSLHSVSPGKVHGVGARVALHGDGERPPQ